MTVQEFKDTVLPLKNKLFAFAFRYVRNREEAEDIVQDVMLKVWNAQEKADDIKNIEAWCMTLTRNRSLDVLKSKSSQTSELQDYHLSPSQEATPDVQLERKEMMSKIKKVIDMLPLKQKEVVELRDFQGMSYKEIADILGADINVVKVNLHRARKTIQEKITQWTTYGIESA
ncbi:MAG: sigma-70 family RNA polymerase sigma factor [Flavobacteriales bacterium]|nr:sigma-70 family RNA polymerase sigma factor [Flavobacteriales bacterium]